MSGFESDSSKKERPLERADFQWPSDNNNRRQPEAPVLSDPPYPPVTRQGTQPGNYFTWRPIGGGAPPEQPQQPGPSPYYPPNPGQPNWPQRPGTGPYFPGPFQPPSDPGNGGPGRPPERLGGPQQPGQPQQPGRPPIDLVDQAVQQQEQLHKKDEEGRSWLSGAMHFVTDPITHALGLGNSSDTMSSLHDLQKQYHELQQRRQNADEVKNKIYTTIAHDKDALHREDTDAGYGAEFVKAAALFAPKQWAPVAAGTVFALDKTNNITSGEGLLNLGLGFGQGYGLSKLYGKLGESNLSVPMQGIALGFSSRAIDMATDLNTFKDKNGNWSGAATWDHVQSLGNLQNLGTDAAVFVAAHGLFRLGNSFSGNVLSRNPLAAKMFTAGSFGLVSDATGEAQRQIQQNGSINDWSAVLEHGVVGGTVNALGGGITGAGPERTAQRTTSPDGGGDNGGNGTGEKGSFFSKLDKYRTPKVIPDGLSDEAGNRISQIRTGDGDSLMNLTKKITIKDLDEMQRTKLEQLAAQDGTGAKPEVVQRNGGSYTREGQHITSMETGDGRVFRYSYADTSPIHPQEIIFPDGRRAVRVVDEATPVWHEFDASGAKVKEHNDVYKVMADGSLMRYNEDDNYRATTWRPDGSVGQASGVDEVITTVDGRQVVQSSPLFLIIHGEPSPAFIRQLDAVLQSVPKPLREAMQEQGQKIVIGDKLTDVRPELKGVQPSGWKPGETWSMAEGLFDPKRGDIVVAEHLRRGSRYATTDRGAGVLRHELGHGANVAAGENGQLFSESQEFRDAHAEDFANMPAKIRKRLEYFHQEQNGQPTYAGRDEAFAELTGLHLGGGAAPWLHSDMVQYFPRTLEVVRRRLAQYEQPQPGS